MKTIPAFDLQRQESKLHTEISTALDSVLQDGKFINGPEVKEFEKVAAEYIGVRHAVSCGNGTDALILALMACGIGRGDEVITTPFTFVATVEAISLIGAVPVFVDIHPATYNLNTEAVADKITVQTKAILPVHLFGQCADMDHLLDLARQPGLAVIEDAAQAFGAAYKERRAGSLGTCGCFSFYPTKNLGAFGDGGLLTTDNDECAAQVRTLKNHGGVDKYQSRYIGLNSRLDTLQAAILLKKLPCVDTWNARRLEIAARYTEQFQGTVVVPPEIHSDNNHVFHQYCIQVENRDKVQLTLQEKGIGTMIYYKYPIYLLQAYEYLGYRKGDFPVAESVADKILALPMFPELTDDEIEFISKTVIETT